MIYKLQPTARYENDIEIGKNMIYQLQLTTRYENDLDNFLLNNPDLINAYEKALMLLVVNPRHPSLKLQKLKGKLKDYHSIRINLKYRIMIIFEIHNELITLVSITNHYA